MLNLTEDNITDTVIERFSKASDPRLKEILDSLVRHLHGFAREVQLTETELVQAIDFLTRVGHITDDKRQEFILLSDTLGLSMLTVMMNNRKPKVCTEATVFGPFYVEHSPEYALGDDITNGAEGTPCLVRGHVRGVDGEPVAGAMLEVWQSDGTGHYDVQKPGLDHSEGRGVLHADENGAFHFRSIVAMPYPIPDDGPVGQMLRATNNSPWRPAHLHFMIKAPGYRTLVTHVFRSDSPYLDSDVVFGVRESLVTDWVKQPDGTYLLDYDFVLNPAPAA
jgi:hydroxyquinol 1,2-dioxygenase